MKKKLLAIAIAAGALGSAGNASAIIVGGVDFGILGESPISQNLESTTVAETFLTASGQTLTGYGVVNTVNGLSSYAGTDKLYFIFTYTSQNFTAAGTDLINGTVSFYLGNEFNLLTQSSAANLATIAGYSEWVQMTGHDIDATGAEIKSSGTLLGSSNITFGGSGLLDVDLSGTFGLLSVANFLNGNSEADSLGGFADITITTSGGNSVLNTFDDTTGCSTGSESAQGKFCIQGSADLRGKTVNIPEPATIALTGLGLLGVGFSQRRQRKA